MIPTPTLSRTPLMPSALRVLYGLVFCGRRASRLTLNREKAGTAQRDTPRQHGVGRRLKEA